jgi:hypothetical protein
VVDFQVQEVASQAVAVDLVVEEQVEDGNLLLTFYKTTKFSF